MASRNIYHQGKRGFTLLEILITVSIMALILALGLLVGFDTFRGYSFRSERAVVVTVLERARSRSMANLHRAPHGVCFVQPNYIIFQGKVCDTSLPTNELIPANPSVSITGLEEANPAVFAQLSGKLSPELTPETAEFIVTLTEPSKPPQEIKINNEGTISW